MSRFTFTKSALDKLPVPSRDEVGKVGYVMHWDTHLLGFGIQVRPSGLKTFILLYRSKAGRSRRITIGRYGKITLDQAREVARRRNGEIALGGDPAIDRDEYRATKTMSEVMDRYITDHLKPHCSEHALRSGKRVQKLIAKTIGKRLVNEITDVVFRSALNAFITQPGNYNTIRSYVASAWTWGRRHGFISKVCPSPVEGIEPLPSTPQARRVTKDEYAAIFRAIEELMTERRNDPARLLACLFVVRTGCRPVEAVRLRREHVNRTERIARLYDHKTFRRTGTPKLFWLTPSIMSVIQRADALHQMRGVECEYVFPRRGKQKASPWLAKTWKAICKRAGVTLTLRHLRSGFINAADDAGFSKQEVAGMTQHMSLATIDRHYRVIDQKRAEKNAWRFSEILQGR